MTALHRYRVPGLCVELNLDTGNRVFFSIPVGLAGRRMFDRAPGFTELARNTIFFLGKDALQVIPP